MKALLIVMSFFGLMNVASADQVLVSCRDNGSATSGLNSLKIYSVNGQELLAEVSVGNEVLLYVVSQQDPVLPGDDPLSLFDSLRYKSVVGADQFKLELCSAKSCRQVDAQGARLGSVKLSNRFEFDNLACVF